MRVRPKLQAALEAVRQIKAHAPHCRVILTVYEMKRLGRDSAALADHITAHGIALEMLAGPLTAPAPVASCSRSSPRWPRPNARTSARPPPRDSPPPVSYT